jgi:hypothetical protein
MIFIYITKTQQLWESLAGGALPFSLGLRIRVKINVA